MPKLETLDARTPAEEILAVIGRDGACILSNAMNSEQLASINNELTPFISDTQFGRDEFTGKKTRRIGALVARSPACRDVITNKKILGLARQFLSNFSKKLQINTTQAININPGEGAQTLHRDRLAWGTHLPREIETQLSTIWALTDFTEKNGATRIVPGSQHWDWKREARPEEICAAVMKPGSVLIFTGSVIHSGGQNDSEQQRTGLNITYCLGWLRQEENQYLSCPPEVAKTLDPDLQELLGYTQSDYALGYYSDPNPKNEGASGILPPEVSLGRKVRSRKDYSG